MAPPVRLRLPATSANLGPGFDALGLAMDFALHIDAREAGTFSISATGRDAAQCGDIADSMVIETYRSVLAGQHIDPRPLHLDLHNEIPLGMGCGSSAAALVAGVALASHFGGLRWTPQQILTEASLREGHPDNVAACVLGNLTVSSMNTAAGAPVTVDALSITPPEQWPLLVVMPETSLSTKQARALLPDTYPKADAIANIQRVVLLTTAFAQGRGDLLARAMEDRMHQPYRLPACPLLEHLLPLAGKHGILGVALSGAGPSVLLILEDDVSSEQAEMATREHMTAVVPMDIQFLHTRVGTGSVLE